MAKTKKQKKGFSLLQGIKKGKITVGATRQQVSARKASRSSSGKKSSRE